MIRVLAAFLIALCAPAASAQDTPTITGVDAGLGSAMPFEAWAPIRVEVTGGTEPASGVITVAVSQFDNRIARFSRPFASAPGARTSYEIPVRLTSTNRYYQGSGFEFEIRLEPLRGRAFDVIRYDGSSRSAGVINVDSSSTVASEVFLVSTPASPAYALPDPSFPGSSVWSGPTGVAETDEPSPLNTRWFEVSKRAIRGVELPSEARTLEAAAVIVLHTESLPALSGAQRDALLGWVRQGGRLVIIGERIAIDNHVIPRDAEPVSDPLVADDGTALERTRWPVGLGIIAQIPEQPADVSRDPDTRTELWLGLFDMDRGEQTGWWYETPVTVAETRAVDSIVERFTGIEPPPVWWLFVFVGIIAVCTGPLDRLVMKRLKLLHRSWASALGWIAIASGFAVVIPMLITGGPSHAGRVVRVDVAPDGAVISDTTVAMYATATHRARPASGVEASGRWQHVLGSREGLQSFFTPVVSVGDGAALPPLSMRTRSLLAYRETSDRYEPAVTAEVLYDEEGARTLVIDSDRAFNVESAALWTDEGVFTASLADTGAPVTSTVLRFPFPAQAYESFFEDSAFDEPSARQRARAMATAIGDGSTAYACISLIFDDGDPIASAPPDAEIVKEIVHARLPVAVDPPSQPEPAP
ncbi:MAG: hypothetical protein AAGH64_00885 [Planctomycetota bacterium]